MRFNYFFKFIAKMRKNKFKLFFLKLDGKSIKFVHKIIFIQIKTIQERLK